jgi:hypothetical protein
MTVRKKNVMMTDDVHCALMEVRMKIYKNTGTLLTMEKVIAHLINLHIANHKES